MPEEIITFIDFKKLDIKVGTIRSAEHVPGSEKLLKFEVDLGTESRQILGGFAVSYTPEQLVGKQVIVLTNLEPKKMMGLESQGMILAADIDDKPIILQPQFEVPAGTIVC